MGSGGWATANAYRCTPYFESSLARVNLGSSDAMIDLGAGLGRHSLTLASSGHRVVAVEIDWRRIDRLRRTAENAGLSANIWCVCADGTKPLPFGDGAFDLGIVVHFIPSQLVANVGPLIRHGGYLLVETYGGHGENWRSLPKRGQLRDELAAEFDVLDYRERPVGPSEANAASVRFLARRR